MEREMAVQKQIQRQFEEQVFLSKLTRKLSGCATAADVFKTTAARLTHAFKASGCSIHFYFTEESIGEEEEGPNIVAANQARRAKRAREGHLSALDDGSTTTTTTTTSDGSSGDNAAERNNADPFAGIGRPGLTRDEDSVICTVLAKHIAPGVQLLLDEETHIPFLRVEALTHCEVVIQVDLQDGLFSLNVEGILHYLFCCFYFILF